MPIIYLDVLLAVNWVVDFLLLSVTARILRLQTKQWRLVVGALLGAVSACLIFLATLPVLILVVFHFLCACILIKITFPFANIFTFLKQVFVLYTISAFFSGSTSFFWNLTKSEMFYASNGIVYFDISPLTLTILAVISYGAACMYEYVTRRKAPLNHEFELMMDDGCGTCSCRALYDTGMHLSEPFSGKPVVIIDYARIEPYLNEELKKTLYSCTSNRRVRYIPYRALGADGLLPAFIPQKLHVKSFDRRQWDISGTYVAVSKNLDRGEYQALIGSDSVERSSRV